MTRARLSPHGFAPERASASPRFGLIGFVFRFIPGSDRRSHRPHLARLNTPFLSTLDPARKEKLIWELVATWQVFGTPC